MKPPPARGKEYFKELEGNLLKIMSEVQQRVYWLEDSKAMILMEEYDQVMDITMKIIANKGNVPQPHVATTMARLSALSMAMRVQSVAYQAYYASEKDAKHKKNMYYTIFHGIDEMVNTLKFLVKSG